MPNYFAIAAGNLFTTSGGSTLTSGLWSLTPTGTAATISSLTSSDVLYANGRAITINGNLTVAELRNDINGTGATAGGTFTLSPPSGGTLNVSANVFAGSTGVNCVNAAHSGSTINFTGNTTGGSVNNARGINIVAGAGGVFNFTGNAYGGTTPAGAQNGGIGLYYSSGTLIVVGNLIGTTEYACQANGAFSMTGNILGGNVGGLCLYNFSGSMTINGDVTAGTAGPGINGQITFSAYTFTINGTVKSNAFGNGSSGLAAGYGFLGNNGLQQTVEARSFAFGDRGLQPTLGVFCRLASSSANTIAIPTVFGSPPTTKTLVDSASVADYPAASNVRSGVAYAYGNQSGTLAVPAADQVASGVAVGATTGTAVLTSAAVQSACAAALQAFSGGRLADVATVASTGQQIADATV